GAPVDLGAVPDVVDQHCSFQGAASFSTTGPRGVPQRRSHPAQWTGISGARSRPATQRPASPRTSPRDFAQPGLPVQAVTPTQGEAASTAKPASASVAATASAPPGSRSRSTTLRRGVIRTSPPAPAASASTVAWAPDSLPSGGTASSATLPSRCSTNPAYGGTGARGSGASRGVPPSFAATSRTPSGTSASRQASSRTPRNASAAASIAATGSSRGPRSTGVPASRSPAGPNATSASSAVTSPVPS